MGFWKSYRLHFFGFAGGAAVSTIVLILGLIPANIPAKSWFWFFMTISFTIAAAWRLAKERGRIILSLQKELEALRSVPILGGTCKLSSVQRYPWEDQTKTGAWLVLNLTIRHISLGGHPKAAIEGHLKTGHRS